MNKVQVQLEKPHWYAGCAGPLQERTMVCTLRLPSPLVGVHWQQDPWLTQARQLFAEDPLPHVGPEDWPSAFLLKGQPTHGLGAWVVALTVALQRWARDPVWQGAVLPSDDQSLRLAIPWERQAVAQQALKFAVSWVVLNGQAIGGQRQRLALQSWLDQVRRWLTSVQPGGLAPNTLRFVQAAQQRQIPFYKHTSFVQLGWGAQAERLDSSFTGQTANLAVRMARNKNEASQLLASAGLPVPRFAMVASAEKAEQAAQQLGWPVVIKPSNQDQGTAVVPGIRTTEALHAAFAAANRHSPGAVMLEKHVPGQDYRLLVVGGQLRMATQRVPGGVVGDGQHNIAALIERTNADPLRGANKRSLLIRLSLDEEAMQCLAEQGLTPQSVPDIDQYVRLRRTANISTGGTAVDVTRKIHPDNARLAERAARIVGLDIAGVDFLCPDISRSWREVGGAICEVNGQPGFRVHWLGDPERDINGEVVEWLFRNEAARIPTAAITGTNGKTTVSMMLHHIWLGHGRTCGVTTTAGTWVGREQIGRDNLSGLPGARMLLNDPAVEAVVIELPRKGLIGFGHPCDRYDVAALLNVQDDHIGNAGIRSLQDMAHLKAEVLERATNAIVVNAEDPLCLVARARAGTQRHILVGRYAALQAIEVHRAAGGEAVFVQTHEGKPWIVLATGAAQTPLMPLHEIPATMGGLLKFNESNALFAVALAWAQGLPLDTIRQAMAGFHNSPEQNPGRYNFVEGLPFQVLVDYCHNPAGMDGLFELVKQLPVKGRRILVNTNGLRFRHHLAMELPKYPEVFDEIYLGQYEDYFRRFSHGFDPEDPLQDMLRQARALLMPRLRPDQQLHILRQHTEALRAAVHACQPGDLLVMLSEWEDAQSVLDTYRRAGSQAVLHEA